MLIRPLMLIRPPAETRPRPADAHQPAETRPPPADAHPPGPAMPRAHAFLFPLRHACHSCHLPAYTAQRERMTGVPEMTGSPPFENF